MSRLKLFGFTAEAQQALRHHVHPEHCEVEPVEVLAVPPAPAEVWVVHVAAVVEFLRAVRAAAPETPAAGSRPPAVLWVPQGQAPLAFDDGSRTFATQLEEVYEADRAMLDRISRCVQVLTWGERVADIPAAWFAAFPGSPHLCRVDDLPFDAGARQHLTGCAPCQEEVYTRLQQRATRRWDRLCPSVEELTTWLEDEDEDAAVETHVARCGLCRETVQWQTRLWEKEGLLPAAHVHAKRAAVGLGRAVPDAVVWLTAAVAWQQLQQLQAQTTAVRWGVMLAVALGQVVRFTGLASRSGGAPSTTPGEAGEALAARLAAGEPVTGFDTEHWLDVEVADDTVLLRAGRDPAEPFAHFRVEFQRRAETLVGVDAEDGVARLRVEHFQTAQQRQADRLRILGPLEPPH